jgi:putative oxidoreductase
VSFGLLVLRLAIGVVVSAHGFQKLFGWFGGNGVKTTAAIFEEIGFRAPLSMTLIAGLSELGSLVFAAGLATPFAAAGIVAMLVTAFVTVQWKIGFFNMNGGYEYNIALIAAVVAVSAIGPGDWSLDHALGWNGIHGAWWGAGAFAAGVLAALAVLGLFWRRPTRPSPTAAAVRGTE